jgi:site-specific DNA recombinase
MSKSRPAVAFDRVSSHDQRDGFSLEAQEKLSGKYARENGLLVIKRWSVSESASKEDHRKHFFEMVDQIKEGQIKDVIFDKVDRACRGLKSAMTIEELIDRHGVKFHFTRDNLVIDSNSPSSDKLRFYLSVILAKYYIDNLKSEIKKGMDERLASGYWNHKAPLGYRNFRPDSDSAGRRSKATVEIDTEIGPYVREAFELYATGNYTLKDLNDFLSRSLNGRKLTKSCVEKLLSNPFYYGVMKTGGVIFPGKHPSLISKELWDACQKIRGLRAESHQTDPSSFQVKPFMNFIRCGICGHLVTGQSKRKASGKTYVYYHCALATCPARRTYTPQSIIETQLIAAFEPFSKFTSKATQAFIETLNGSLDDIELTAHARIGELVSKRQDVERGLAIIEKLHREGNLSQKEYDEILKARKTTADAVETEIRATMRADKKTVDAGLIIIELLQKAYDFMRLNENLLDKVRLAKIILSNPVLKDGTLCFSYQKPFDDLIELTNKNKWWTLAGSNR